MPEPILTLENAGLRQGGSWLFRGLDLTVDARDRLALIGRNGVGKTTLLKLISGEIELDEGRRAVSPALNIVRLEQDPDLAYPRLPVSLNEIQRDLDRIRGDLAGIGSGFALTSFFWLVKDGLVLDPIRHKYILQQLNTANYPYRYRDMERLAAFQNRVFARYASTPDVTSGS